MPLHHHFFFGSNLKYRNKPKIQDIKKPKSDIFGFNIFVLQEKLKINFKIWRPNL